MSDSGYFETAGRPGASPAGPERLLGVRSAMTDGDDVAGSMPTGRWLAGAGGLVPAGALGVLADDVLGIAIVAGRPEGTWSVSGEISLDLLAPVPCDGTPVIARARLAAPADAAGGVAAGTVTDADGNLIALCRQHGRWVRYVPPLAGQLPPAGATPAPSALAMPPAGWQPPAAPDLATLIGARVRPAEGGAELELAATAALVNPMGNLHGGITLAACDLLAQVAMRAHGGPARTASIHVSYPRPVPLGAVVRFEGRALHRGRALGITTVRVTADGRKPCAIATVTTAPA